MLNIEKKFRLSPILALTILLSINFGNAQIPNILADGLATVLNINDIITVDILPVDLPPQNGCYDIIIVGAGPAGCVLANRLSENPNTTVYLLEAGGKENLIHDIPAFAAFLQKTNSNWGYMSVPQKKACFGMNNNICALPRGRVLSGTSAINLMIYMRGNRIDYDRWAEAGNRGWSYEEVLPYFKRSERANLMGLENSRYHNTTGPLSNEFPAYYTDIAKAFVKGAQQAGHKVIDYNGESQIGVSQIQATTLNGHRHTAAKAYLDSKTTQRKNLHILTSAFVTKILIEPRTKSAYGVEFLHRGKKYTIRARKEVILSAGAFNSPKLLMLSGIGPKDELTRTKIPIIHELPVGKIMYDHMSVVAPIFTTETKLQTLFVDRLTVPDYLKFQAGDPSTRFSTLAGAESVVFMKTPNSTDPASLPDVEMALVTTSLAGDYGTAFKDGANFRDDIYTKMFKQLVGKDHCVCLGFPYRPKSYGNITLRDSDPTSPPIIDPNYFMDEEDIEVSLAGIKECLRIAKTPAMQEIGTKLFTFPTPGCEDFQFGSDDYWRCTIKVLSYTLHHQVGTCKMGPPSDPTAVVNHLLKVHGIRKLRVCDTGIAPSPPAAHLNAMSFMIGEKCSDMIKEEWEGK